MTGTLGILLRAADDTLHGAPVRVHVTDTQGRGRREEIVLVGAEHTVSLPRGAYTVRAVLPSGLAVDGRLTTVARGVAHCVVDLDELSPAPWLTPSAVLSPSVTHEYQDFRHGAYATSWARLWAARGPGWQSVPWPDPPAQREPTGVRLTFNALEPVPHMIQTGVGTGPWTLTTLPLHDTVHVTVRPVWAEVPGLHVSCLTPETGAHALLGYSSAGAVNDALSVARWLIGGYSASSTCPHVVAAALGHHLPALDPVLRAAMLRTVLVSTAGTADGAVIAACGALDDMRQTGAERSADTLCQLFLRATAFGMPTLTLGLRHLLDALRLLARTPTTHEQAVRRTLVACEGYRAAADTRSPFLAFHGSRPDAPGHEGVYLHERPNRAVPLVAEDWAATLGWSTRRGRQDHFRHGMRRLAEGQYADAVAAFKAVLAARPDHAPALAARAAAYRLQGDNENALRDADRALELDPDLAWAYATRGAIHRYENRYVESLADLDRAIELQPDYDWCIAGRGETYRLMGKTDRALDDLNRAVEINPANDWALKRRVAAYMDAQKEELAQQAFYKAAKAMFDADAWALPDDDWALAPAATPRAGPENSYRRMGKDLTHYARPAATDPTAE
ncbi:tetratricopeptide repeat protein [Streptomyces sp. NPDC004561]